MAIIARILSAINFHLEYILQVSPGSQVLLDNAERYGLYLAKSLNGTIPVKVLLRKSTGKQVLQQIAAFAHHFFTW